MGLTTPARRGHGAPVPTRTPRRRRRYALMFAGVLLVASLIPSLATAAHPEASLSGSNFEIDEDANLKVDDPTPPSLDWANVAEIRATDKVNGTGDDSYAGGVKEDTTCPGATTDSIPPNKSDLLSFHVYREAGVGTHPGFLNLAWSRVSEPSGTTLMDFEFNQSATKCASGPNVVRTAGDLLIEYAIDQGGARAAITARTWNGAEWGPATDIDAPSPTCGGGPCAVGTINSSPIPAADSDGLIASGQKQARTFGEAQIDLRLLFQPNKCASFGSAMLKSRSSDSFTSQLKDFVAPVGINLQNCGQVIIRKQTVPDENPNTTLFNYTKAFATDPTSVNTFQLTDDGVKDYGKTVLFGSGYTVTEGAVPSGWEFVDVNCSASSGVTPTINGATVTFDINADTDVLDCTYTNRALGDIIVEKITDDSQGSFAFTSGTLTPASFTLTTTAAGAAGKDSRAFNDLPVGTYDVAETVPAGWNLVSATCDDGSNPAAIGLSAGETVTCTFHDAREKGAIEIVKTRKHAADGSGDHPHSGVTFTITGGELPAAGIPVTTNANGIACLDNLPLSSSVGNYTVTESVPAGYVSDDAEKTVSVTTEDACGGADNEAQVSFHNTPLTNVTVSVDSQVPGGTASTISCVDGEGADKGDTSTGANGDGSLDVDDLLPTAPDTTLVCTIVVDP
ncbi:MULTISPECIES: MSCRAMM family protein [unclassified Nocardioides]|uniref:MSCRAMM family protein n=1 Tax=unclassified Nocardioides TaxID=2615069 RepID=UPI0036149AAA